jgi:hypothetical protein
MRLIRVVVYLLVETLSTRFSTVWLSFENAFILFSSPSVQSAIFFNSSAVEDIELAIVSLSKAYG